MMQLKKYNSASLVQRKLDAANGEYSKLARIYPILTEKLAQIVSVPTFTGEEEHYLISTRNLFPD
jgi:hypothetical protein